MSGHLPTGSGTAFHETEGTPCLCSWPLFYLDLCISPRTPTPPIINSGILSQVPEHYCALVPAEPNQVISSLFSISCLPREDPTPSGLLALSSTLPPPSLCFRHSGLFHAPQTHQVHSSSPFPGTSMTVSLSPLCLSISDVPPPSLVSQLLWLMPFKRTLEMQFKNKLEASKL